MTGLLINLQVSPRRLNICLHKNLLHQWCDWNNASWHTHMAQAVQWGQWIMKQALCSPLDQRVKSRAPHLQYALNIARRLATTCWRVVKLMLGAGCTRFCSSNASRNLWTAWIFRCVYWAILFSIQSSALAMEFCIQGWIWCSKVAIWASNF